ncbi:MAG: hypothetical protein JO150_01110 [Acidobacteriaceae bacterium]|nr:hypothetical protein [Acidobacteriaceae bacterium]
MTPSPLTPGAVSDTGPVHYLLQIGQIDLLPRLLGRVWVPGAAIVELTELTDQTAPHHVRSWVAQAPDWFLVTEPSSALDQQQAGLGNEPRLHWHGSGSYLFFVTTKPHDESLAVRGYSFQAHWASYNRRMPEG